MSLRTRDVVTSRVRALWDVDRVSTLGVVRRDGTPHLTPVKSMLDVGPAGERVLVLTRPETVKAAIVRRTGRAGVAEHTRTADWATLEGPAYVTDERAVLDRARELYAERYGIEDHWGRCVIVVEIDRVLSGS